MTRITNEEAFLVREDEADIGIDYTQHKLKFHKKWFMRRNQKTWSTFLPKKFPPTRPLRIIQIGVFEGMDLVWCCQNILGHPSSMAVGIDTWEATPKIDQDGMDAIYLQAKSNLNPWRRKVHLIKGRSQDILSDAIDGGIEGVPAGFFDLVVIDGDHAKQAVTIDAIHAHKLLRIGGWMIFDDVRNRIEKRAHVVQGMEKFLENYGDRVNLAWAYRYCNCYERMS